jgi:hypothetical protein
MGKEDTENTEEPTVRLLPRGSGVCNMSRNGDVFVTNSLSVSGETSATGNDDKINNITVFVHQAIRYGRLAAGVMLSSIRFPLSTVQSPSRKGHSQLRPMITQVQLCPVIDQYKTLLIRT